MCWRAAAAGVGTDNDHQGPRARAPTPAGFWATGVADAGQQWKHFLPPPSLSLPVFGEEKSLACTGLWKDPNPPEDGEVQEDAAAHNFTARHSGPYAHMFPECSQVLRWTHPPRAESVVASLVAHASETLRPAGGPNDHLFDAVSRVRHIGGDPSAAMSRRRPHGARRRDSRPAAVRLCGGSRPASSTSGAARGSTPSGLNAPVLGLIGQSPDAESGAASGISTSSRPGRQHLRGW